MLDLLKARELAREAIGMAEMGIDPREEKRTEVAKRRHARARTVTTLARDFVRLYCKPNLRTWREIERTLNLHIIPVWGDLPASDITRRDAIEILEELVAAGMPFAAGDVLKRARKMFNWAVDREELDHSPFDRVKLPAKLPSRDRTLDFPETAAIWKASDSLGWPFGAFFRVLLLTGQRRNEIANLQWRWLRLDGEIPLIEVPAAFYKSGTAHVVPLSPPLMEIVKHLPRFAGEFVFSTTDGQRSISGFSKAKERLDQLAGVHGWRVHDIRRTVATELGRLRVSQTIIDRVLGHSLGGVQGRYNQYAYLVEKYEALSTWARAVEAIVQPAQSNVAKP
jgi:integrase